jgi:Tol biopolymer transport system component
LSLAGVALATVVLISPSFSSASFSGHNGKVFYAQNGDIWSANPDGTGAVDLTAGGVGSEQRPSPSADGRSVVYQALRGGWGPDRGWNIYSMKADGSNRVNLTNTEEPVLNFEPSFSPDGSKIVFMRQSLPVGDQDIWVIEADGTGAINLTNSPGLNETAPEFSPDGTKIVYISTEPKPIGKDKEGHDYGYGFINDIWVMNADGTSPEQMTETSSMIHNVSPTWSPDSTRIAYSTVECTPAEPPACGEPIASGLHVMNADGTEKTLLLNEGNQIRSGQLSWSPDGTRIAFDSWTAGGLISTVGAAGGAPTLLVANTGAHYPSWAPMPPASEEGTPPVPEGTPPTSPGGSPATPPVMTPATGLPAKKRLKCGKGKRKKVVKGRAKCVKKPKSRKSKTGEAGLRGPVSDQASRVPYSVRRNISRN